MRSFTTSSRRQGFTIVEVVVVLCVVGIVAAVGYVWWQGRSETSTDSISNQSSNSASVTSTPTPTPDPTASWKSYTTKKYNVSFKYPADMVVADHLAEGEGMREVVISKADHTVILTLNVDAPRGCAGSDEVPTYGPDFEVTLNDLPVAIKDSCLSYVQKVTIGGSTNASLELAIVSQPEHKEDVRLIVASMKGVAVR